MYFLLKMGIFQCHVSFQGGIPHPSPGGGFHPPESDQDPRTSTTLGRRFSKDLPSNGVGGWAAFTGCFLIEKRLKGKGGYQDSPYLCIYIYIFSFMSFKFWSLHVCSEFCLIILVRSKPFLSAMAEAASVGRYLLVRWHVPNFGHAVKWRNLPWSQWKKS